LKLKITSSAKVFCQHAVTPITKKNTNFIRCNLATSLPSTQPTFPPPFTIIGARGWIDTRAGGPLLCLGEVQQGLSHYDLGQRKETEKTSVKSATLFH